MVQRADIVRRWTREFKSVGSGSVPRNGKQNLSEEQNEIIALKKALNQSQTKLNYLSSLLLQILIFITHSTAQIEIRGQRSTPTASSELFFKSVF